MMSTPDFPLPQLIAAGQNALAARWPSLTSEQQAALAAQLTRLDLPLLRKLWSAEAAADDWTALAARAEPPAAFRLPPAKNPWNLAPAIAAGRAALEAGQVGVLLVAGGQGTRLGFDQPKGMYPIGPVSGATLYQILLEQTLAVRRRHGQPVPLYVMTSPATHEPTETFLRQHGNFGLPRGEVKLFCQGMLPALDAETGDLLLDSHNSLALSPDGHGGLVAAFAASDCLAEAERRGLRYLYYVQVDNPLVQVADPEFLGYHILSGSEMSTQVIAKRSPTEKVGNVVTADNVTRIIEYSDLPTELAERVTVAGEPVFWAGNIAVHVIDIAFLRRVADSPEGLPFHIAKKKVPYLDAAGQRVSPEQPNAVKFERFIFDLLPQAREAIVMEVDRATTFAPVKNAPGELHDTPQTVQAQMSALYAAWLRECGIAIPPETTVEISPLAAMSAEELRDRIAQGAVKLKQPIQEPVMVR